MPAENKLNAARRLSWQHFGKKITFYLPGMFHYNNMIGKYPALSITGDACQLQCEHCKGKILSTMITADDPEKVISQCIEIENKGAIGVLLSGGSNLQGQLPWDRFFYTIRQIKEKTRLLLSVHSGFVSFSQARALKKAGVDQALIDVIGDKKTFESVYHLPFGPVEMKSSICALVDAGLEVVPHIVCGLFNGKIQGEYTAVDLITHFDIQKLVIVSLMGLRGTPMFSKTLPNPGEVADIIVYARMKMPNAKISLGCARQRGNRELEVMAVRAGVNSMALPSDEAIEEAVKFGLEIRYQKTCCSVSKDFSTQSWEMEPPADGLTSFRG